MWKEFLNSLNPQKRDEISIENCTDELKNMNIYHQMLKIDEANLKERYEKLAKILKCAKDKDMPMQILSVVASRLHLSLRRILVNCKV